MEEERRDYHTCEGLNHKKIKDLTEAMGGLQDRAENRDSPFPALLRWFLCLIYQCICLLFLGSGRQQKHLGMYCLSRIYLTSTCISMD